MTFLKSWLLPFCLFAAIALGLQVMQGAYRAELGAHADEAAHFVTGLFLRDASVFAGKQATTGDGLRAVIPKARAFSETYYEHYPKIGLGVWPPVFYLLQAAWTLVFPATKTSVLILMGLISASMALVLFRELRRSSGYCTAYAGAVLVLLLPLIQQFDAMIMAEILSALWIFSATAQFGKYLETERPRHIYAFGVLASLAILTKGTGLALALVLLIALLATQKFWVLKRFAFWATGVIVAVLAGPWTVYFARKGAEVGGWEEHGSVWAYAAQAAPFFGWKLLVSLGVLVAVFAFTGAFTGILFRRNVQNTVFLSLILAVFAFQVLVPASQEERHLTSVMPAIVFLAIAGAADIGRKMAAGRGALCAPWLLTGAYAIVGLLNPGPVSAFHSVGRELRISSFRILEKGCAGFGVVAEHLVSGSSPDAKFLVSSDAPGEGMFISEVAMREERPGHVAQRVSKVIAESKWSGGSYRARFETPEELRSFLLNASRYDYLVIDRSVPEEKKRPHHDLILAAAESDPAHFLLEASHPVTRGNVLQPEGIRLFRVLRDGR